LKIPRLNLYQLIVFFYVANERSITSAAEKLCLTQPTVSSHIHSLEKSTGLKLIEVNKKRISLTNHGETLYHYCKEIYNQALAAERFIELQTESILNIGISPILVSTVARAISNISNKTTLPFKLNLHCGGASSDLVQGVLDSKIDFAIVPFTDYHDEKLGRIRISDGEPLFFYASNNHPLFNCDRIDWKDLCQYPLVIGQGARLIQKLLTDKLAKEEINLPLQLNLTSDNVECCKIIVQDGRSISISLLDDIKNEIESGKLKILALPNVFWIEVDAVLNRGFNSSAMIQNFITSIKSSFPDNNVNLRK
jgi:LysR family transcriptional regulator, transcriptional activator of the cysJI operon